MYARARVSVSQCGHRPRDDSDDSVLRRRNEVVIDFAVGPVTTHEATATVI